jgi:hypothetical protein
MEGNLEALFEVDGKPIRPNSIHAVKMGPGMDKLMLIRYDPKTDESVWVAGSNSLLALTTFKINSRLFTNQKNPSGKEYLLFKGREVFCSSVLVSDLTPEQIGICKNWYDECEKSGYGGRVF